MRSRSGLAGSPRRRAAVSRTGGLPLGLAVLAGIGLLAAGCAGSKAPSVAGIGGAQTATTASASGSRDPAAFARCMTSHGFAASLGSAANASGKELSIAGVVIAGSIDPSSPQFQAAMQACRTYLPGGGPRTMSPAQRAEWAKAMAKFAACMRTSGVPSFPDPTGEGTFPPGSLDRLQNDSALQSAGKTCQSLEPKFGPRIRFG